MKTNNMQKSNNDSLEGLYARRESLIKVIAQQNEIVRQAEVALCVIDGKKGFLLLSFKDEDLRTLIEPPVIPMYLLKDFNAGLWLMLDKIHSDASELIRQSRIELHQVETRLRSVLSETPGISGKLSAGA